MVLVLMQLWNCISFKESPQQEIRYLHLKEK